MPQEKKKLSFWQIWNMSFGFLGIQFGFALQGGFMSRIFQTLGADKDAIPFLWIAAPLTGLLVQPIVGYLSDRTWHPKFGRRKPFFFFGAVFSTIALFFAPYSSALWMAAGSLWILDASINISMEPFRALVADKLPESQRSYGFMVQTLIIGIGTWVASNLPWMMTQLGVPNTAAPGVVPDSVKYAFGIGAFVLFASILYTILRTEEYPPEDLEAFEQEKESKKGFFAGLNEILHLIATMPTVMKQLGLVQFFSWFAFFTMWSFATPSITEHVFGATDTSSEAYNNAADSVGNYLGTYGLSILSMPYAMLSGSVEPKKMGVYMGIFNMFIVIPQIVAALGGVNFLYKLIFGEAVIYTMLLAGTLLILAGLCNLLITDRQATHD
jgi:maltose/moltooligosaccharide transporter